LDCPSWFVWIEWVEWVKWVGSFVAPLRRCLGPRATWRTALTPRSRFSSHPLRIAVRYTPW
jgi:hypothetical protein